MDSRLRGNDEFGGPEVYSHSNRSCRLAPAHQGMKSWSCRLLRRIGMADSAAPHPRAIRESPLQGGWCEVGRLPCVLGDMVGLPEAGDKPQRYIDRGRRTRFFDRRIAARSWCVDSRLRGNDELRGRSCGLLRRIGTADSATPLLRPSGGQAPRLAKSSTALHSPIPAPLDSGLRRNDEWGSRGMRAHPRPRNVIPDRGPGHAFVPMTESVAVVYPGSAHGTCLRSVGRSWQIRAAGEAPRRVPARLVPPGT